MNTVSDILETLGLELPCPLCGRFYHLPLKSVGISQQMLHDGCPVSDERECAPVFYGPLLDPSLLGELETVWTRLDRQARGAGGRVVVLA